MAAKRLLLGAVAACATAAVVAVGVRHATEDGDYAGPAPSPTPSAATTTAPAAPPPAPRVGSCHRLTFGQATAPTDESAPVPCTGEHTSVTIHVGRLDPVVDGHLLAVDSREAQAELARKCPPTMATYVGGSQKTQRLSRLTVVWFGPTVEQADAGARWFRCDLVALGGDDQLAPLARRMRGVLDRSSALDQWGTCGTAAPGTARFARVVCARPHRWRAVDVVALPAHARFLGKPATAAADRTCQSVAADRAQGALKYSWSFEWPTRQQWQDGRRYGLCWVPAG
jgi:hypothetical protein